MTPNLVCDIVNFPPLVVHVRVSLCTMATRVEALITDHLNEFVSDMEKYKVVLIFHLLCKKIEIRRTTKTLLNYFS